MATTYVRTWQMNYNAAMDVSSAVNSTKNCCWQMKAVLKGEVTLKDVTAATIGSPAGLWTCVSSSDGVSAAGSDLWTSSYVVGKLVIANAGSNHSWMVLKSPNNPGGMSGNLYFTIDLSNTSPLVNFYLSKTLPTGGTVTNRPTSPDEMTFAWQVNSGTASQNRMHSGITTEGTFFFVSSKDTDGQFYSQMLMSSLLEQKSVDGFPFVWVAGQNSNVLNQPFHRGNLSSSQPTQAQMRDRANLVTVNPSFANWQMANGSSTHVFATMTTTDTTDSNYGDLPCYVCVDRGAFYSTRGRVPDLRWAPEGLGQGSYEPSVGTPVSTLIGSLWVPTYIIPTL